MRSNEKLDLYRSVAGDYSAPRKPFITENDRTTAVGLLRERGKPAGESDVRLRPLAGAVALNSFAHGAIRGGSFAGVGSHHEIYLSDPRRVRPERLRTILRMPVRGVTT